MMMKEELKRRKKGLLLQEVSKRMNCTHLPAITYGIELHSCDAAR